jgi:uncharacterized coiled-coil protein SlyX
MSDDLVKRLCLDSVFGQSVQDILTNWRLERQEAAARIEELEAKLAKAVEALGLLDKAAGETARMGAATGPHWTRLTIALLKSRTTLAELKGEKDE